MIQCALRTKIKHISALSALGTDVLFLHLDICGVALKKELNTVIDYTPKITACQNELEKLRSSIKDSFINK